MIDHGSSVSVFRPDGSIDADLDGPEVTGARVVLENVVCVLMTPLGSIFYDATAGVSRPLQSLVNATIDAAERRRIQDEYISAAEQQAEGVVKADIVLIDNGAKGLVLTGTVYTDEGPGQLEVSAADALKVLFPGSTT